MISAILDTVGWYGRSVEDLILGAEAFRLDGLDALAVPDPRGLRIGYCETPFWDQAEAGAKKAMAASVERLRKAGAIVEDIVLPAHFGDLAEAHTMIMYGEGRVALHDEYLRHGAGLHPELRLTVENGRGVTPRRLVEAFDLSDICRKEFDAIASRYDAVLAPASTGEAPRGLHTVGNWIFNGLWTLLHTPCVAIPAVHGELGLPVGIQLVGPRLSDARLLAVAKVLQSIIDLGADERARILSAALSILSAARASLPLPEHPCRRLRKPDPMEPCFLTAAEAAARIRDGKLTSEALIRSCIERIEARDPQVKAWLHIDKARAIATARELDKRPAMGALHGLPFGVKDMIDTADMPTTYNSPVFQGYRPARDAACVGVARLSGAVILGKTDTVEFASAGRRAATRKPEETSPIRRAAPPRARARRWATGRSSSPSARRPAARISGRPRSTASTG